MPFPSTPRNNQLVTINGTVYVYSQTDDAWTKYGTTSANLITTDTANITSNTSSTSTATGALRVAGGLGVQGNVFAGAVYTNSYFFANGAAFSGGGGTGFTGSAGSGFTGSIGSTGFTGSGGTGFTGSVGTLIYQPGTAVPYILRKTNSTQTSVASGSQVLINLNSTVSGNVELSNGSDGFRIPRTGLYAVDVSFITNDSTHVDITEIHTRIFVNGSQVYSFFESAPAFGFNKSIQGSVPLYLNTNDEIKIYFWAFNDTLIVGASSVNARVTELLPPAAGFVGSQGIVGFTGSAGVGTNLAAASAHLTSGSTSGTGWQKVPINTVSVDEASWWDAANTRFRPTIAGWYLVNGRARTNSSALAAIAIGRNGTHVQGMGNDTNASQIAVGGSQIIYLNGTTDFVDLRVFANTSGVAYTTGSFDTYLQISGPLQAGPIGFTGSAGPANGFTGSIGFTGSASTVAGFAGSQGTTGFTGSFGSTGFTGSFGSTGFVGSTGFTGSIGVGFAGSAGFTGSTGTGFTGSAGTAGAVGFTGSAGGGGGGAGFTGSAGTPGTLASGQVTNTFTGNGTTTAFTLSVAPVSKDAVTVNIDGVTQQRSGYTVNGFVLTLDEAPLSGEVIEVTVATYGTTNFVTRTYTGNGTTSNFAVTLGTTVDSVIVTENGVVQTPTTDYTITGNVLTILGGAPAAGTTVGIREIPAGAVGGNSVYSRTLITATAGQTSFAVAYTVGFLQVYFNGVLLPPADYTATTGSTVVLVDPAAAGDLVEFVTYNVVPVTQVPVATFNSTNLTANLAITAGYSAVSVGPINIANGVTISIADGQKWVIL